jgi:2-keto-3-deoxy-L-rhamnonate aldolase RhmA
MAEGNISLGVSIESRERILRHATLEDYIEANGGLDSFLEGLADLWKSLGLDESRIKELGHDVDTLQARMRRMRI